MSRIRGIDNEQDTEIYWRGKRRKFLWNQRLKRSRSHTRLVAPWLHYTSWPLGESDLTVVEPCNEEPCHERVCTDCPVRISKFGIQETADHCYACRRRFFAVLLCVHKKWYKHYPCFANTEGLKSKEVACWLFACFLQNMFSLFW